MGFLSDFVGLFGFTSDTDVQDMLEDNSEQFYREGYDVGFEHGQMEDFRD